MEIIIGLLIGFGILHLTYIAVYDPKYAIWLNHDFLNRKPFNCHKCLNFWTGTIASLVLWQAVPFLTVKFFTTAISITILWTLLFIYEEKKKTND